MGLLEKKKAHIANISSAIIIVKKTPVQIISKQ